MYPLVCIHSTRGAAILDAKPSSIISANGIFMDIPI